MRRREEKKNTMLLTVIAVATLLVAVVGATFAYFSLSVSGTANTTATVTAGSVGTIELTGGTTNLKLKVNATDMTQAIAGTDSHDYYAITDTEGPKNEGAATGGIYSKSEKLFNVGTVTLSNGDAKATYACGYKITVTKEAGGQDMSNSLQEGDMILKLVGAGLEGTDSIDLTKISPDGYTGTFTLKGTSATANVQASLKLVNQNKEQNALAGKEMTVKIVVESDGNPCKITTTDEE